MRHMTGYRTGHVPDVGVTEHKAVLHTICGNPDRDIALIVPVSNVPELKRRLWMVLAYTEVIGNWTYDHYDVSGMRRNPITINGGQDNDAN